VDTADELRLLRARAYGPDADIVDDPAALARLDELETSARTPVASEPVHAAESSSTEPVGTTLVEERPGAEPESDVEDDAPAGDGAEPEPVAPAPRGWRGWRGWSGRRMAVVGAVALVVVVLVAVAATSFVTRRAGYAAPVDAVLAPSPGQEIPSIFGMAAEDSVVFADFSGLTPVASDATWNGQMNDECLMLVETEYLDTATENSFSGMVLYGCGAGPFPPSISFVVAPSTPEPLRERYPDGTAMQFVLEDNEVVVLSSPPDPAAEAPAER
jgi:hypothetical protein